MASGAAQRAIGIGQIIGGLAYMIYGGGYGGTGGGSYLIGSGIANAGGSKYGSARRGTQGLIQDTVGSLSAAGASMGIGGGKRRPEDEYDPSSSYLKDLLTQQNTPYTPLMTDTDTQWTPEYLGLPSSGQPTPLNNTYDSSAASPGGSHIFQGLRNLLLGEYA